MHLARLVLTRGAKESGLDKRCVDLMVLIASMHNKSVFGTTRELNEVK